MAMFLSRIKRALNLGTKSITQNGTYNASSDGYDGYSSVEVNVSGVTPTPITPSNSNPAALTSGTAVSPTANGYAIESYSSVTPSNSSPATITSGSIYKASANGKAVASVTDVTPLNIPTSVAANDVVKLGDSGVIIKFVPVVQGSKSVTATASQQTVGPDTGYDAITEVVVNPQVHSEVYAPLPDEPYNDMGAHHNYRYVDTRDMVIPHPITPSNYNPVSIAVGYPIEYTASGYAIHSYDSVTPSSTQVSVSEGDIVKIGGSGVIVDSVLPTPTSITPSNSSPVVLSANTPVNPTASGYAISSYSSKTPSDSSPASVSSGAIIKASASGYLVSSVNGNYSRKAIDETIATTWRITGLTPGRKYLVLVWGYKSSANMAYDTYDNAGVSNGTITKVSNLLTSGSIRAAGTFYYIKPTSSSVDLVHSTSFFAIVLDKGGA